MKSIIILITLFCSLFLIGQETVLPMKGKYIFYEFKEKTENTKRPILEYFAYPGKGMQLLTNCMPKYNEFYSYSWKSNIFLNSLKSDFAGVLVSNCVLTETGEFGPLGPGYMQIILSPNSNFLDNSGLGVLLNMKKKKITSHHIKADIILKVHSDNEYSLIITNFKYHTSYIQGTFSGESGTEVINVEELMTVINDKENKYRKTEKETAQKYIDFIDKLTHGIAGVFREELSRLYEIDELY
jgi:hypothetical protein